MRKTWLVIQHEFTTAVSRPSFWLTTFLFPLFILGLSFGPQLWGMKTMEEKSLTDVRDTSAAPMRALFTLPSGYVDRSGLIQSLPPSLPPGWFIAYEDEAQAADDLQAGKLARYYVVAEDYLTSGEVTMVTPPLDPLMVENARQIFTFILDYNLLHDEGRTARLLRPTTEVRTESLTQREVVDESSPASYTMPMGMMILFLMLISMSSGFVLNSVVQEKENRAVEMLLLSLNPRQLMAGKLIGVGLVALLQLFIWIGGAYAASQQKAIWQMLAEMRYLDPALLRWSALYFVLGYIVYAAEMGALGTLIPSRREGGSVTFFIFLPIILPAWLSQALMDAPNGTLATALSLFPLSAPVAMPTRMLLVSVPLWQRSAAAIGLALTAWLFLALAARFFRADTLLSYLPLSWRRLLRLWKGSTR